MRLNCSRCTDETGQAMVLVAFMLPVVAAVGFYLIVNALYWTNAVADTRQAVKRAAQDGAATFLQGGNLPILVVSDPSHPDLPTEIAQHCLDPVLAREVTLESLKTNLGNISAKYVTDEGHPLSPEQLVSDHTGVYLIELKVVNPPGLGCPASDPEPVFPPGATYPYTQPYVHLAVYLPVDAIFGAHLGAIHPKYVVDVTSAVAPTGGR